jgi:hypothetical protein
MKIFDIFASLIAFFAALADGNPPKLKCGISRIGAGNVWGGVDSQPYAWPWLVALRLKENNQFFCAGNLISAKHIVSGEKVILKV